MKPRLMYVCLWDAADRNSESGYAYSMRAQLMKRFDVIDLFPLPLPGEKLFLPLRAAPSGSAGREGGALGSAMPPDAKTLRVPSRPNSPTRPLIAADLRQSCALDTSSNATTAR